MPKITSPETSYEAARAQEVNELIDFIISRVTRHAEEFTTTKVSADPEA